MIEPSVGAVRRSIAVALVSSAMLLLAVGQGSAQADVTAVKGSAYGYSCVVSLFGSVSNNCTPPGPTPTVTLASDASNSPQTGDAASARAAAGPAIIFSSGPLTVSTQGTTGPSGSVTSSANIQTVNTSNVENLTASNLFSSCTASESGVSGSTTITGGTLQTDNGDTDTGNSIPDHAETIVAVPINPAANTEITGHLHVGGTTDNFRWVFNEQIVNADGSITVNAAHEYLIGPTAVGDLILGQVVCGVTAAPPADTTPPDTTIDSGPSGTITTDSASFTFSSSEAGSTFECKLDGPGTATGTYSTCTSAKSYSGLADGTYTFSVRATDAAGNTDATPATQQFTVNTTPVGGADLGIDVTGPLTAPAGEVTYTVNVTNAGPGTATGVVVDTKISGGKFVSSTNATCAPYKGKIRCDLGDMTSGTTSSFTLVIKKGRRAISATSTVSSATSDPNAGNNTDTQTTTS